MQFRQIQATLHSWLGIVVLWSVFLIFFTGSIAYFRTGWCFKKYADIK